MLSDDVEGGVEQPPHLVGVVGPPLGQRLLGDAAREILRARN